LVFKPTGYGSVPTVGLSHLGLGGRRDRPIGVVGVGIGAVLVRTCQAPFAALGSAGSRSFGHLFDHAEPNVTKG
jgi:hypothetical protein